MADEATVTATPVEAVQQAQPEVKTEVAKEVDLDGLDSFVFQGKKYTPEELRNEMMMRADYTKKTQELAKYKKYDENLDVDLAFVRKNPQAAEQFKKIYPEKYHRLLDVILERDEADRQSGKDLAQTSPEDLHPALQQALMEIRTHKDELEQIKGIFHEQKVQANMGTIDHIFKVNTEKYPFASEDAVINKVQSLIEMNKDNPNFHISDALWERHFRLSHQENEKRYEQLYKARIDEQLKKGERAKDSGPGGLAPGRERKKVALGDVADIMIADLSARS